MKTKGWIIAKGGKKRKPRAVIKAKGGKSNTSPKAPFKYDFFIASELKNHETFIPQLKLRLRAFI